MDTHYLIWFQEANPKIPLRTMQAIQDTANAVFFSQVSLFEIAIKQAIGKLPEFTATIDDVYQQALTDGFAFLPIQNAHIKSYGDVPFRGAHRDPFDRLLIATAATENLQIITADADFSLYTDALQIFWS